MDKPDLKTLYRHCIEAIRSPTVGYLILKTRRKNKEASTKSMMILGYRLQVKKYQVLAVSDHEVVHKKTLISSNHNKSIELKTISQSYNWLPFK